MGTTTGIDTKRDAHTHTYTFERAHTHSNARTQTHIRTHTHSSTHTHTLKHTNAHTQTRARMCLYIYIYMCVCVYVCVYNLCYIVMNKILVFLFNSAHLSFLSILFKRQTVIYEREQQTAQVVNSDRTQTAYRKVV